MRTDLEDAIAELESEIKKKTEDLMALRRARDILGAAISAPRRVPSPMLGKPKPRTKPKSGVRLAEKALQDAGGPLHIKDILNRIASSGGPKDLDKISLASSLLRYSKQNKVFKKTAPNTFDLLTRRQATQPTA